MWSNESQEVLQANLHTKTLDQLSKMLGLSKTTISKHRIDLLKKQKLHKERPAATYSNRSPYGFASPGLTSLNQ